MPIWNGKRYNEDWVPIGDMGVELGPKDWEASRANERPQASSPAPNPWGGPSTPAAPKALDPFQSNVQSKLLSELNLTPTVDKNDPAFAQQVEAQRFGADRTADRARQAMAQRMHAQGTSQSGGMDTGIGRIISDQGASEQAFESQLTDKFRGQNLDRMARALQLGTGLLSQQQERELRSILTREGYDLQKFLGMEDINFRRDALAQQLGLSEAQMNQNAMMALLGGGR